MNAEPELTRRLHELADSVGGWDDPLPGIRQQAAADVKPSNGHPGAGATAGWEPLVHRPYRRRPGWKVLAAAAAAAIVGIGGIGVLARLLPSWHTSKASTAAGSVAGSTADSIAVGGQAPASAAAGTAGVRSGGSQAPSVAASSVAASSVVTSSAAGATSAAGTSPPAGTTAAGPTSSPACLNLRSLPRSTATPQPRSDSTPAAATAQLRAPAQVRVGSSFVVHIAIPSTMRATAPAVQVLAFSPRDGSIVGALRPAAGRAPVEVGSIAVTGSLQRWSCSTGADPSTPTVRPRSALPVGTYVLVATVTELNGHHSETLSTSVRVTVVSKAS